MRKAALIYSSVTGNTEEVVRKLTNVWNHRAPLDVYPVKDFCIQTLNEYDAIMIGTYTWGDGEIPQEMQPLYEAFETQEVKHIRTAVFGTGDSFYPNFCGAVDKFRDMLFVQTTLLATLKIELAPQSSDEKRIEKFATIIENHLF